MTGAHSSLDGHLPYLQDMYLLGGRGYDGYDGPAHGGLGPGVGVLVADRGWVPAGWSLLYPIFSAYHHNP